MNPADTIAQIWFTHHVTLHEPGGRTAYGPRPGKTHEVQAGIQAGAQKTITNDGEEVTASATLRWHIDGPLPKPGWAVDLPAEFGLKPGREVLTARRNTTGTGMTPDHVEVTIR